MFWFGHGPRCRPALGITKWIKLILLGGLNFVLSALYAAKTVSSVWMFVLLAATLIVFVSWVGCNACSHARAGMV